MDIFGVILPIIFILIIAYGLFTGKGRRFGRKIALGDVIEDYGVIGKNINGKQQLRLLKCIKNQETYYVLEVQSTGLGSMRVDWIKLNDETINNLVSIVK